jgi:hypothetical protein
MPTTTSPQQTSGAPYNAVIPKTITWGPFNGITSSGVVGNLTQEHKDWLLLVGEFVFVLLLGFIADTSPAASKVVIAFLLGLWLLWLTLGDGAAILNAGLKAMGLPQYNQAAAGIGSVASGVS